ncbi:MAG: sigma-54 dependent transcriptional regulator [Bacteroidales bacterium]|nr:sigma-54 dependent transcriptional regulator [Bacteroidales bacterium]
MKKEHLRIFVVEDDEWYNKLLVHHLNMVPEYEVKSFLRGKDLLDSLYEMPDAITLDYRLPDIKGSELLKEIRKRNKTAEVVVISEQEDVQTAVDLLKEGAFDYLVKNEEIQSRLQNVMGRIRDNLGLKQRIEFLEQEVEIKYGFEKVIIGKSPAMIKVMEMMKKAVSTDLTVTITGETGTGKEVAAKAIHYNSSRKNKPFVPVNMSAIPSELFESEFFGHEKGAFTGAVARRKGKFEEAKGGTLFLDEITETDLNFQPKLLRALQEREISRIGSNELVKIDCRIIVASNRSLQYEVKNGNFRQDLYYRLLGLPIDMPPLRDRDKDIILLALHFLEEYCRENQMEPKKISESAMNKLMRYSWPGNVRELKSIVELGVVMSTGEIIEATDIIFSHSDLMFELVSEEMTMKKYNQKILDFYLNKYNRDIPSVSKKLGISQATIYRMLKEI